MDKVIAQLLSKDIHKKYFELAKNLLILNEILLGERQEERSVKIKISCRNHLESLRLSFEFVEIPRIYIATTYRRI